MELGRNMKTNTSLMSIVSYIVWSPGSDCSGSPQEPLRVFHPEGRGTAYYVGSPQGRNEIHSPWQRIGVWLLSTILPRFEREKNQRRIGRACRDCPGG